MEQDDTVQYQDEAGVEEVLSQDLPSLEIPNSDILPTRHLLKCA